MLKNIFLGLGLTILIFSCSLFEEEEPAGLKTPTELHTLNDSLVSISEEWTYNANSSTVFENPVSVSLTDNFIYILDLSGSSSIKRFDYEGNFIDILENVKAFYTDNNFIYKVSNIEINKYTEDFTLVSSVYISNSLNNSSSFAAGNDQSSIITKSEFLAAINYQSKTEADLGSNGNGPLQFNSSFLYITKHDNFYYILENGADKRIQILNLDGTYDSEFTLDTSIMFRYGGLSQIALNDTNAFVSGPGSASGQIQMFKKSGMTYLGFFDLGEIYKNCVAVSNNKIYVVSNYPTSKIIVLDIL